MSLYSSLTFLVLGYNQTLRSWNWTWHLSQCAFRPLYAHPSAIFTLCCSVEAQDWCDRNEQASKVMAHCSSGKEMSASFVTWMTFTLCVCCGVVTGLNGKQALRGSVCCLFCCRMLFIEQSGKVYRLHIIIFIPSFFSGLSLRIRNVLSCFYMDLIAGNICSFRMFCLCALLVNDLKRVKGYSLKVMIVGLHDQLLEKMTDYVIAIKLLIWHKMSDSQWKSHII